ncbi:MFS transporter [Alkalibacter rhizosphaerae]|uniref:MFS transporter n=1 Tax=Alkalibacter rhizosphaerae TaxID=2815577 RepID=A0A974XDK9_9FIRM|nr:MFS transporter [Alkalibacter rhizosphaerae]QSX07892.1 MFS transporter [Alkalibacter rhizosphaerae]
MKRETIWTKNYMLLFGVNMLMSLGVQFLLPTLPLYATQALGGQQSQIGYLMGAYSLAALVIRPFAGYAYDVFDRKKVYLFSLTFFALITYGYPMLSSFFFLVLFRFLHGISFGSTSSGGGTIVGDIVPESRRGEGVGLMGMANTLSMALGPAVGLMIMGRNNFTALFYSSALLITTALVLAFFLKLPKVKRVKRTLSVDAFIEKRVFPIAGILLFSAIANGGILSFIVIFAGDIGVSNGGVYFMANSVGVVLTRLFSGRIMDRKGPWIPLLMGYLSLISGYLLLSAAEGLLLFVLSGFIVGLGNGMVIPTLQTMTINSVEASARGVATSTYFSAMDIGIGGGSIMVGWLVGIFSLRTVFVINGILCTLSLILARLFVIPTYERKYRAVMELKHKVVKKHTENRS